MTGHIYWNVKDGICGVCEHSVGGLREHDPECPVGLLDEARKVFESYPGATGPAGDDGGWVYVDDWEAFVAKRNEFLERTEPKP